MQFQQMFWDDDSPYPINIHLENYFVFPTLRCWMIISKLVSMDVENFIVKYSKMKLSTTILYQVTESDYWGALKFIT